MKVLDVEVRHFRGFKHLHLAPGAHAALVGEPRSGRSDLLEGIARVLSPYTARYVTPDELDFWNVDTSTRAEVEVVLGDLGAALEQDFLDHLEAWDSEAGTLAAARRPTDGPPPEDAPWVLRLCYRIEWDADQEAASHWVDFPGESDPAAGDYVRISRRLHDLLPVVVVGLRGRVLRLHPQAAFRQLVDDAGLDLGPAFERLVEGITNAGETLAEEDAIRGRVGEVLKPVEAPLGIDSTTDDIVRFVPEGGSLAGILRSLQPSIDLGPPGHLPLVRQGSTATGLLEAGEVLAGVSEADAVVLFDDFGDGLDAVNAHHVAALLRQAAGQLWLGTRLGSAMDAFPPEELVRLITRDGQRRAHTIDRPTARTDRVVARHLSRQLLGAASAASIVIVEGPHDRAAVEALVRRRFMRASKPLLAAYGVALVDAGAVDGSGGSTGVVRLSAFARRLGFHTIALIDWDRGPEAATTLANAEAAADRVIRFPEGAAIERAIVGEMEDASIRTTTRSLCTAYGLPLPRDLDTATGHDLADIACGAIKSSGGLHAQFIDLIPTGNPSPVLTRAIKAMIEAGRDRLTGHCQL